MAAGGGRRRRRRRGPWWHLYIVKNQGHKEARTTTTAMHMQEGHGTPRRIDKYCCTNLTQSTTKTRYVQAGSTHAVALLQLLSEQATRCWGAMQCVQPDSIGQDAPLFANLYLHSSCYDNKVLKPTMNSRRKLLPGKAPKSLTTCRSLTKCNSL
jgi:hypothetical protein